MKPTTPQIEDRARVRVSEIMGQIRLTGSHGNPTWGDPIVADLMRRRYNWQNLCAMTETELHWWGKEFVETYRAMDMQDSQQYPQIEHRDMKRLAYGIGIIPTRQAWENERSYRSLPEIRLFGQILTR